ncbi:MAG: NfeD family protein [Nevskia sp.]|nr:NfeD family protein [Nevskia sp.]
MEITFQFWHWWVAGLALLALEAFLPGAFFLWMGVSALLVGALLWLLPELATFWQVVLFAILSIGSVLTWRRLRKRRPEAAGETRINERGRLYEGRSFTLGTAIVDGIGNLRVDDGQWRVAGPDLPAGTQVRVIAVEGATLRVERAPSP